MRYKMEKSKPRFFIMLVLTLMLFHTPLLQAEPIPLPVFVSVLPQAYFVEKIGGDRVSVDVFVLPGKSPAIYAPTPTQMVALGKAKLYFRIGVPFENAFIPKIRSSNQDLKIIDTRKNVPLRQMESVLTLSHDDHHGDHHGHDDHHHDGDDPHIWLSPPLVMIQAKNILDALCEEDPQGEAFYKENYQAFIAELDKLHNTILSTLANAKGEAIFVFHPSFGYFTDTYGLKQMAVEVEGKAPKGRELSMLIKKAKEENVRVIFAQPQFDMNVAQKIAGAINGIVVPLDPLSKDYEKNLLDMAEKISGVLGIE